MTVRQPAVAGLFYPDDPVELKRRVVELLDHCDPPRLAGRPLRALIAPHAGFVYSGAIAANAYRELEGNDPPQRVVLLGPSHRVAFRGVALAAADNFAMPMGNVTVDAELSERALSLSCVTVLDEAHRWEHSLEVQIPFIQHLLPNASVLPLVVGDAKPGDVEAVLDALTAQPDTFIIVSTDLSHFLDYESAQGEDRRTSMDIEARRDSLGPDQACGCRPLNGLLRFAKSRGLDVTTLDVRNSGDTAGARDRVVGYGAYAVH